ncbi:MAG TPA: Crp/Fnr family transcriptional regulator [Vicinamibacteria bacterium]|nr:Crp/Fnr family transcriptional regulator [Vicinamibacteria bacterium]
MLTKVERVLILKGADLLREVGPRRLLKLAEVAREVELSKDGIIYREEDAADALYMVVEGRVRLSAGEKAIAEVGPGEAFGTWALVDDAERGQKAECIEDGLALAVHRDEFYDVAAGDLTLLQEVIRALARRLRTLVSERPEEARVEGEGVEKPEAMVKTEEFESDAAADAAPPDQGTALSAAVLGKTDPEQTPPEQTPPSPKA